MTDYQEWARDRENSKKQRNVNTVKVAEWLLWEQICLATQLKALRNVLIVKEQA